MYNSFYDFFTSPFLQIYLVTFRFVCVIVFATLTFLGDRLQNMEQEPPPQSIRSEIISAVKKMNTAGKAPEGGNDCIPAELYKAGGDAVMEAVEKICLDIYGYWEMGGWLDSVRF